MTYRLWDFGVAAEAIIEAVRRDEPPQDMETRQWWCLSRAMERLDRSIAELAQRLM